MKLLIVMALSFSMQASMAQQGPPNTPPGQMPELPNCPEVGGCEFVVACTISDANGERGMFRFSQLSYPVAASMFAYTENAIRDWYADLRELLQQSGVSPAWVPDPESPLSPFLDFAPPSP